MTVESSPGKGCRFKIRLYMSNTLLAQDVLPQVKYIGYVGVRRRILIVDNEKADRDFLVSALEPIGFQVLQAESGQACLDLMPSFHPHLVFMDLAMPGIDGWETIRLMREAGWKDTEIAVISANVYEKGADNDVGITPEYFITKPVNVTDLLNWIGLCLDLDWVSDDTSSSKIINIHTESRQMPFPPQEHLHSLNEQIELGYVRGIMHELDEIGQMDDVYGDFVGKLRQLASRFQFENMKEIIRQGVSEGKDVTY